MELLLPTRKQREAQQLVDAALAVVGWRYEGDPDAYKAAAKYLESQISNDVRKKEENELIRKISKHYLSKVDELV